MICLTSLILTHSPLKILPKKRVLKLVSSFLVTLMLQYKEPKLTTKPFTGRTLRNLLIQMQNISL